MSDRLPRGWKKDFFNVGVLGKTGVGKSTLINAYFRVISEADGSAATDVVECTSTPAPYHLPGSEVALWDTPGFGTQQVLENEDYFERIHFYNYDFYILVSCNKVNEFEKTIHQKILEQKKGFFYIRTKMDQTIKNEKRAHPRSFNEAQLKEEIRGKIGEALREATVWLVASHDPKAFDFPDFEVLTPHAARMSVEQHRQFESESRSRRGLHPGTASSCTLL